MRAILDTNILIDFLRGIPAAKEEIARYTPAGISVITWMEVIAGARDAVDEPVIRTFLAGFVVHPLTFAIAERAAGVRRERRVRLPDAIIWATAIERGELLVTRNTRDFPEEDPGVRVPYRI